MSGCAESDEKLIQMEDIQLSEILYVDVPRKISIPISNNSKTAINNIVYKSSCGCIDVTGAKSLSVHEESSIEITLKVSSEGPFQQYVDVSDGSNDNRIHLSGVAQRLYQTSPERLTFIANPGLEEKYEVDLLVDNYDYEVASVLVTHDEITSEYDEIGKKIILFVHENKYRNGIIYGELQLVLRDSVTGSFVQFEETVLIRPSITAES